MTQTESAARHPAGTLAAKTSLFASAISTVVEHVLPLREVLEGIRSGQWAYEVAAVRAAIREGNRESADHLKKRLPAFTVSAELRTRARDAGERVVDHSGWLQADFDAKDNPGMIQAAARDALMADEHCGAVFVGPSGGGIKALVRIDPARHAASVEAAVRWFRDTHGLRMDEKCRDVERLCFVSHDADAWFREGAATVLPVSSLTTLAPVSAAPSRPSQVLAWKTADVRELLSYLPKQRPDYDTWLRVISGVGSVLPMAEAVDCLQEWSPAESPGEYEQKWRHRLSHVTIRTVIHMAQAHGFDARTAARRQRWMGRVIIGGQSYAPGEINADLLDPDTEPPEEAQTVWEALMEQQFGDASIFARKHQHDWKHDEYAQRWRRYNPDNGLWEKDMGGEATLVAREVVIESYAGLIDTINEVKKTVKGDNPEHKRWLKEREAEIKLLHDRQSNLGRANWCAGMMSFAQKMPSMRCRAMDFDKQRHLLAVKNGVLNFRDNRHIEFSPRHMLASAAPVEWIPGAQCPQFSAFLLARMGGDEELVTYLWRLIGYSLTGFVDHDALFLCYGTGSNGKSTLFKVLERLLGPQLALTMDIGVLLGGSHESINTVDYKKANLEGKRLVLASEPAEDKPLNEAMVKQLLGGEDIQARRLYEMPYSFAPTHKIWVGTNHKPNIKGTDHGIWRRIHLIPWLHKIPVEEQRPREEMVELYCQELPGILNAALAGYGDFLARGGRLDPPSSVVSATNEYRQDEDGLGNYLSENVRQCPESIIKLTTLLEHYRDWCQSTRERPVAGTARKLSSKLRERGYNVDVYGRGGFTHLIGCRLVEEEDPKAVLRQEEAVF